MTRWLQWIEQLPSKQSVVGSNPTRVVCLFIMKPVDILLLISELEGCYTHTKRLGFEEDMAIFDQMKKKYYKLYFKLKRSPPCSCGGRARQSKVIVIL